MGQEHNRQGYFGVDFPYIFRSLWKNAFIIIACTCMTGVIAYIFLDNFQKETYTASVNLSVISRDNNAGRMGENSVNSAVTRSLNVLNSDTLKDQVKKADEEGKLTGDFTAVRVGSSNIITLQATSTSAESAFRLLKMALEAYPTLSGYFESGYLLKTLNHISAENIVTNYTRTGFYTICAVLLALLGGVGLTGCICLFTDKIHSREQAEAILDLDILGVQHYIRKKRSQKSILISDQDTDISYVEEIDKLVTRVQEKMDAHAYKVLMVSSIKENEGKSTIAANVALSLARRGKKVTIVDADLRRPALYKIFDKELSDSKQLTNHLEKLADLESVMEQVGDSIKIRGCLQKKAVGDPDRLLGDEAFGKALQQISMGMDYVIIDTPPIGIVRDAEVVAGSADATLLILKQDFVKGAAVNDVVDVLDDTGVTVLGGVLTMAKGTELSGRQKGRYGKYYYGYGYGKE